MKTLCSRLSAILVTAMLILLGAISPAFAQASLQPEKDKADNLLASYQIEPALKIYQEIISHDPGFANCYFNMAICYNQKKQFDKAYSALEKFVRLKPQDSEAIFNMGIMQIYLGNNEKARTLLFKARAQHPNGDIKRRIQNALDHLEPSIFPEESLAQIKAFYGKS
ncbi:MAG: tetratricopeptide repeat protein [Candidatus Omnitrophica bacterium]|nr:tetratricopeptide repeat protein [Candidatus Omnitrophota bacterium]